MISRTSGLPGPLVLLLAPLAGAMITLSLAPYNLWPLGILSCALLLYLLHSGSAGAAPWRGWLFGLGMFGSGVSWVYVSIHVHGHTSVALAVFLTGLFCAGLSLLPALLALCYVRFIRDLPAGTLLGFPAIWVLCEWLRSWLLTGFPWLYLGYPHIDTWLGGWAPVLGIYGLSFICAITASCLYLACRAKQVSILAGCTALLAALWSSGALLKSVEWVSPATDELVSVAIVQPNVPQEHKWDRRWYRPILSQLEIASLEHLGYDLLVWPEAAVPNFYQGARDFIDPLAHSAAQSNTTLITGIPFRKAGSQAYHNSIIALGNGAQVYHKQRLVPFGEYVPLENWLRGLIAFFDLPMSSFSPGPAEQEPLKAGSYSVAPFICYEIVYPDMVAASAGTADLMITISNDSWFGDSLGPLQHLQMARMRALENGRYLIRGTNNGISAIINHRGELVAETEQFVDTVLTGEARIMRGWTPFARFGSYPVILACFGALLTIALVQSGRQRRDAV